MAGNRDWSRFNVQPVPWQRQAPEPELRKTNLLAITRLFSGIRFSFFGFWAPINRAIKPKKDTLFSKGH